MKGVGQLETSVLAHTVLCSPGVVGKILESDAWRRKDIASEWIKIWDDRFFESMICLGHLMLQILEIPSDPIDRKTSPPHIELQGLSDDRFGDSMG